jgi:hypothetical protein
MVGNHRAQKLLVAYTSLRSQQGSEQSYQYNAQHDKHSVEQFVLVHVSHHTQHDDEHWGHHEPCHINLVETQEHVAFTSPQARMVSRLSGD